MNKQEIIDLIDSLQANDVTMKAHGNSDNLWGRALQLIKELQSENDTLREKLEDNND